MNIEHAVDLAPVEQSTDVEGPMGGHPWITRLRHAPDQAAAQSGSPLMGSLRKAIGEELNADLVSADPAVRVRAEDVLLADSATTSALFLKQVEAKMAVLAGGKDDPEMETFAKLAAIRETLTRQLQGAVRLRRVLSRPGPINLKVSGSGPQQFNVGTSPDCRKSD